MSKSDNTAFGFVAGVLIGGIAAMLLTPRNGQEVRRGLKRRMDYLKEEAIDAADKAGNKAEDALDNAKATVHRNRGQLRDKSADNPYPLAAS